MTNLTEGQCLCGAVTFCISGAFESFFLCHCARCRKGSGSAHSANLFSVTAKITWLSGEDQITEFRLPNSRHARCFCSVCGSALPFAQVTDGVLVIPAGSLDSPISIRPNAHICVSSRADWDDNLEALKKIDRLPG